MSDNLFLGCPNCKQVWLYEGFPSDPYLSLVECLRCGYVGVGAGFKRHKREKNET